MACIVHSIEKFVGHTPTSAWPPSPPPAGIKWRFSSRGERPSNATLTQALEQLEQAVNEAV